MLLIRLYRYANFIPISIMKLRTLDSQHLDVDWISFNIQGLANPKTKLPRIYLSTRLL